MMKKIAAVLLAGAVMSSLAACGNAGNETTASQTTTASEAENTTAATQTKDETEQAVAEQAVADQSTGDADPKSLVVYFSWSGNTESVAQEIAAQTGADVFKIEPQEPYTDDYDELLDIAQEEQRNSARPAIAGSIEDLDSYEVIYLGFPNWWGDMPMILYTFLEEYDLTGKTVAPFVTSGGSGFSNTVSTMKSLEPEASFLDGLSLGSSAAAEPADSVGDWLEDIGLAE